MCYWDYSSHISIYAWTGRGYTGHEMHDAFGLINMNAHMYDPILGRMCAPDNLLHPQYGTQGFNRYSYALNNPLKYVDEDGNNPFLIAVGIGALIGATTYTVSVATSYGGFTNWSWSQFAFSTFSGAISGAVTFGIGSAFGSTATTLSVGTITNEVGRAAAHGYSGFVMGQMNDNGAGGFWAAAASSLAGSFGANLPILNTGIGSAAFASAIGGTSSVVAGGNFWQGAVTGLSVDLLNQQMHKYHPAPKEVPGHPEVGKGKYYKASGRVRWRAPNGDIWEWDKQHGDVEVYDRRGKHKGSFNPNTNKEKPEVPGRTTPKFVAPQEMLRLLQGWDKTPKPTPVPLPAPAIIPFNINLMRYVLPERYEHYKL